MNPLVLVPFLVFSLRNYGRRPSPIPIYKKPNNLVISPSETGSMYFHAFSALFGLVEGCAGRSLLAGAGAGGGPDDSRSLLLMVIYPTVPII